MRLISLFVSVVALVGGGVAQSATPAPRMARSNSQAASTPTQPGVVPSPRGTLGSPGIWRITPAFLTAAHKTCDNAQPTNYADCFIEEMAKAGAPPEAVNFTRELYKASDGQVGIMGAYRDLGHVALAWIQYPLRANSNDGIVIIGTDPKLLDVDDLRKLDRNALEQNSQFQEWKKTYPKLDLFPGDRTGAERQVQYSKVYGGPNPGDVRFMFLYPLLDGCRACARAGWAAYWWDVDASGKFLGTKLVSVMRVMPPAQRQRPLPPAGTPPSPGMAPLAPVGALPSPPSTDLSPPKSP